MTEEFKPYQYEGLNGKAEGFSVALVRQVFERAKVPIRDGAIQLYPWARGYRYVSTQADTALFMMTRTPGRETKFKWVGPLAPRKVWLYGLSDRKLALHSLQQAKERTVASYNDSAMTNYLTELGFKNLELVSGQGQLVLMLLRGRVDLIPSVDVMIESQLRGMDFPVDIVEKQIILDDRSDFHIALSLSTPDKVMNRLQKALDEMITSGDYQTLFNAYFEGEK
ncbi:MAG: ABC transporter substrate-binding protein [Motiliproteus sp.]